MHETTLPWAFPGESRIIYEWFAGWRWEHYRAGELVAESTSSFETREDCLADARRTRGRRLEGAASAPIEHDELTRLAA